MAPRLSSIGMTSKGHLVHIRGERSERVNDNEVSAGEGVDEAGAVALAQHVQHARLVEVHQVDQVLNLVQVGWVGLQGRRGQQ